MNEDKNHYLPDPFIKGAQYIYEGSVIFAIEMDTTFAVHTAGAIVQGRSGDFLCKSADGVMWPVNRQLFLSVFRPAEYKPLPPQVAKSENDPGGD